jgi:hypothetical protein
MIPTVPSPPIPVTLLIISAAIIVLGIIVYLGRRPWRELVSELVMTIDLSEHMEQRVKDWIACMETLKQISGIYVGIWFGW